MLRLNHNQLILKPNLLSESDFLSEIVSRFPGLKIDPKDNLSNEHKVLLTYSRKKLVSVLNFLSLSKTAITRQLLFEKLHEFLIVEVLEYHDLEDSIVDSSISSDSVDSIVGASCKQYFEAMEKLNVLKDKYNLSDDELDSPLVKLFFETTTISDMNSLLSLRSKLVSISDYFTNIQIIELLVFFKNNLEDTELFIKKVLKYRASSLLDSFANYNHDFKNMLFCFLFDSSLKVDFETRRMAVNSFLIVFNENFPVSVRLISFLVLSDLFQGFASICSKEFLNVLNEFMQNANDSFNFNIDTILNEASVDEYVDIFNLLENFNFFYKRDLQEINFSDYLNFQNLNTALLKSFIIYNNYSLDFLSSQLESSSRDEILDSMLNIYSFGPRFKSLAEDYILNFDSDFQFSFWSRVSNVDLLMKLNSDYGYLNDDNSKKLLSVYENATVEELDLLNSSNLLSFKFKKILLKKRIELRIDKMKYKLYEAINFTKKVVFVSVLSGFALSILFALLQNYFDTNVLSEFFTDFNVSELLDSSSSDVQNTNFAEPVLPTDSTDFVDSKDQIEIGKSSSISEATDSVTRTEGDNDFNLTDDELLEFDENEVLPESVQIQTENPGSRVHMRDADGEILKNRFGFNRYWKDGARLVVDANSSYEKEIDGEYHMFYEILKSGQRTGRFISSSTWR